MTVSLQTYKQQIGGAGVIAVNIPVMATSDLRVVDVADSTGLETPVSVLDYTLTLSTPASLPSLASINVTTTPAAGFTRWVYRETANVQDLDYIAEGAFESQAHERAIDKRTLLSIEISQKAGILGLRAPISEPRVAPLILPQVAARANKVLAFDGAGEPTAIEAVPAGVVSYSADGISLVGSSFASMRQLLALRPGIEVQAFDPDLLTIAGLGHTINYVIQSNGAAWVAAALPAQQMPRGHLWGLELVRSAAQSIQIQVGECRDAANTQNMTLSSAWTKNINGGWVAGSGLGGYASAAPLALNTWYHVFLIRSGAGVIDAGFDISPTAATLLPTSGYAQYRRLGSVFHTAVPDIRMFVQDGDHFLWQVPPLDIDDTDPGTGGVTRSLSVAPDVRCHVQQQWAGSWGGVSFELHASSLDQTDLALAVTIETFPPVQPFPALVHDSGRVSAVGQTWLRTNTSRQIRYRMLTSSATLLVKASTLGWIDDRGRSK